MNWLSIEKIRKIVFALFFVRMLTAGVKAFLPFDLPHIWRQVDTLGVSLRYWLRWSAEPDVRYPLLPAVLNSMDGYAIMPMEFPLVNLMCAPFFALGPHAGRIAAMVFLFALHFGLTWLCYLSWKDKRVLGKKVEWAFLLLPVAGISSTFVTKFMPDYLAMLLVLWGVSFLWDESQSDSKNRLGERIFALLLMTLGLLVKPTSVTVLVLLLMREAPWQGRIARSMWSLPPLLVAGLYYTIGLKWIASLQDTAGLFAVQGRNPLISVIEFLLEPRDIFKLVFENMAFTAAPVVFALVCLSADRLTRVRVLWLAAALLAQTLAIAALDGSHSFIHSYYHIGSSPVVALLITTSLDGILGAKAVRSKWLLGALAALMLTLIYKNTYFELRSLSGRKAERYIWSSEVKMLKKRNPSFPWGQGYTFRASRMLAYPNLGIQFGEREGSSTAEYGFYLNSEVPGGECRVVDQSQSVSLVRCAQQR
jgi:hypothetical protein